MKKILLIHIVIMSSLFATGSTLQAKETIRDYGFKTMEIFAFKYKTSNLNVYDINKDGIEDIIFLNNRASRLEILVAKKKKNTFQAEELKDRFQDRGFILDYWGLSLRITDFNKDNLPDILTLDNQRGLHIYYQKKNGSFGNPQRIQIDNPADLINIEIADFNHDGREDIFVCRTYNADIIWNKGNKNFSHHSTLVFTSTGCQGALISDVTGDGNIDIILYFGKEKLPLRILPGKKDGTFGWEIATQLPVINAMKPVKLSNGKKDQLAVILQNGMVLRLYTLIDSIKKNIFKQHTLISKRLPIATASKGAQPWIVADFNNDSFSDLCIAAPSLSQVHIYYGSSNGLQTKAVKVDSLNAIKSMKITTNKDIIVFSSEEKSIAIHKNNSITSFPTFIKAPGTPLALDSTGSSKIYALYKDGTYKLNIFNANNITARPQTFDLDIENDPRQIKVLDLPGKNHYAIMVFIPYEKPIMYRISNNTLSKIDVDKFKALGINDLSPDMIIAVDPEKNEKFLVCEKSVARIYRWKGDHFIVEDQLNPQKGNATITQGCFFSHNNMPGYCLYDSYNQNVYWFAANKKQKPLRVHIEDGIANLSGMASLNTKNNHGLIFIGSGQLQLIQQKHHSYSLKTESEYTSKIKDASLWSMNPVELGNPKKTKIAMLDSDNRSIEIVGYKNKTFSDEIVFEIFQDPGFNSNKSKDAYEPHDIAIGDINNDSLNDMAILVHDKLIIYYGE